MAASTTRIPFAAEAVLDAVKQLSPAELLRFDREFQTWREQNGAPRDQEASLLLEIERNSHLPRPDQARFEDLRRKRHAEMLTPEAQQELRDLWQRVEEMNVVRLEAVIELEKRRSTSVSALMKDLGIRDPPDVF